MLKKARKEIDICDEELTLLFLKRMGIVKDIALYKKANNIPLFDGQREREIKERISKKVHEELQPYICELFDKIFEISKEYQKKLLT